MKIRREIFRFILVGILNTAIGLSTTFICFNFLSFNYWVSTGTGNILGACFSYVFNRLFTFKSMSSIPKSAIKFILVIILSYFLSYWISLKVITMVGTILEISETYQGNAAIILGMFCYTVFNFIGQKYIVFK